jgi:hypothetical protein
MCQSQAFIRGSCIRTISINSISNTTIQGISKYGTTAQIRTVDPEMLVTPFLDLLVKSIKGHTGLHETSMIDGIDVEDLVHATTEIDDH